MAEFDDNLNSLLSNPEAMDQIMKMAQSLMGNGGGTEQPPPAAPPSGRRFFMLSGPVFPGFSHQSTGRLPENSPKMPVFQGKTGRPPVPSVYQLSTFLIFFESFSHF